MARRGRGEGTIYQRADGRWEGRVDLGWQDGRRRRKAVYGRTRSEVGNRIKATQAEAEAGVNLLGRSPSVAAYLTRWLEASEASVRPSTHRTYSLYIRRHVIPALGPVALTKLTPDQVQNLLRRKIAEGMAPQSAAHLRAILRTALNRAVKLGLLSRNAAALAERPKAERPAPRTLSPAQARSLVEAARSDRWGALYVLALATGLRQGEVLGLRWQDVDLENGVLRVTHALQRFGGARHLIEPKTKRSRRAVRIPAVAQQFLRNHRSEQSRQRLMAGAEWEDGDFVFATWKGTPLEAGNVSRAFKGLLAAAGVPDMRFHDLRHSCASLLLVEGVHPRVVMELLGHSEISLTLETYSHVLPTLQFEAAAKLDQVLSTRSSPVDG